MQTQDAYEAALLQHEAEEAAAAEYAAKAKAHNEAWRSKWPNHCTRCGGTGGQVMRNYPHAPDDFDLCPRGEQNPELCHRCGQNGLNADAEGPCKFCGWNYDDALWSESYYG